MTIEFYFEFRDFIPWFPKNDEFSFSFIKFKKFKRNLKNFIKFKKF